MNAYQIMNINKLFAVIAPLLLFGCSKPDAKEPEFFGSNFSLSSCMQYAGDGPGLERFLETQMKIKELTPEMAQHFLDNNKGKAWSFTSPDGSYTVAYKDDGVCTVFIKQTNVAKYIDHMNKNIKRLSKKTDWAFSTDNIPMFAGEGKLESYELTAKVSGKNVRIVISATTTNTGNFQVAFSTNRI